MLTKTRSNRVLLYCSWECRMMFCSHSGGQCLALTGLPWWSSGSEFACQCGGHGFNTWSGKNPTCHWTPQPVHHNSWACTTQALRPCAAPAEAHKPRAHALQQERPPKREAAQHSKGQLRLATAEKACARQWRRSTAEQWKSSKERNRILTVTQQITRLGLNTNGLNTYVQSHTLHGAGFSINAEAWKQSSCSPVSEWTSKLWSSHTMQYNSMITNTQIFTAALFVTAKPETTQTSNNRWMDKRTIVV